jgi:methionine biosynthesis protein MetW
MSVPDVSAPAMSSTTELKYTELGLNPDESHALVLQHVAGAPRVLEIGCATGYMSEELMARGSEVVAVEVDEQAAAIARARGVDVRVGTLEEALRPSEIGSFDCVTFADVLEHVTSPETFLRNALAYLRPGGHVVVSIPNVAHWSVRFQLLRGNFDYTKTGLLDDTHVRLFTEASVERLIAGAGLHVIDRRYTIGLSCYRKVTNPDLWWQRQKLLRTLARRWPGMFAFQFVWKAARKGDIHHG